MGKSSDEFTDRSGRSRPKPRYEVVVVRLEVALGAGEGEGFGWEWGSCEVRGLEPAVAELTGWGRDEVLALVSRALWKGEVE